MVVRNIYVDEDSIPNRLISLGTGGCTCMTKTPELQYHKRSCTYRIVEEVQILLSEKNEEIGRLKLVAGRYQFMWEAAQLCINKIDDYLEYDMPPHKTFEIIQKEVQKHLKIYTEAVSGLLKKRGM